MAGETGWLFQKYFGAAGMGLAGLGAYDCHAEVAKKPVGYLFGGSTIQYTANVYHHLGLAFQNRDGAVQSAVESLGNLFQVSVHNDMSWIQLSAYNVIVSARSTIDRGNISDIQADIRSKFVALGFTVNTDAIVLTSAPSIDQICGKTPGGVGTGPPGQIPTVPPGTPGGSIADEFGKLVSKYGYIPLGIGAIIVVMIMRRR